MSDKWIKPRIPKEYRFGRYKVIRIYHTLAQSKREALKNIDDKKLEPETEFAFLDRPKGWFGALVKQVLG